MTLFILVIKEKILLLVGSVKAYILKKEKKKKEHFLINNLIYLK